MVNYEFSEDYHVDFEGNILLDEDGEPIPIHICICHAHSDSECVCGAWSVPLPGEVDEYRGRDW